jgi:C4-dicarboxylate-specific signal transduction histidine kinase
VGAWLVAGIVVLACCVGFAGARRRTQQREAAARARARARRQRVPLVSANVRGQPLRKPDIWREEAEAVSRRRPSDG